MIYLDNAATSWPKPPGVIEAMTDFLSGGAANPGRAGHRMAVEAGRVVLRAREAAAELFSAPDPLRIAFCHNVTEALNLCLYGYLNPGDHIITSSMEHNSMIRPLRALQKLGVELTLAECSPEGCLDPGTVRSLIRTNTRLVAVNHASNVTGTILPVREIGSLCREYGIPLLVDAAQSGGSIPIDVEADHIDFLCFTGHKALGGPTGVGGAIIGERIDEKSVRPLKRGGTGSRSDSDEQPDFLPDAFESGTLNVVGLAGLEAGIRWILSKGIDSLRAHELMLTRLLIDGLSDIPGVTVFGTGDARKQTGTVSFNIDGMPASEAGYRLDEEYGIMCRVGLHCAPHAHRTIGSFPHGSVRFGLGHFNTEEEIERAVKAVAGLARG